MIEHELHRRSDLHRARRLWHLAGVLAVTGLYINLSHAQGLKVAAVVTFLFVSLDILRQHLPALNQILIQGFRPFMRESEKTGFAGTSALLLGVLAIIFFFPREVVTLSLLFLAFADPAASYFGIKYGKDKIVGDKSLQGTLAAFVICTVIAALYFYFRSLMIERLIMVSLLAGLIGALAELIPVGRLDDNLTFPLISSSLLWGLIYIFGGL